MIYALLVLSIFNAILLIGIAGSISKLIRYLKLDANTSPSNVRNPQLSERRQPTYAELALMADKAPNWDGIPKQSMEKGYWDGVPKAIE